MEPDFTKFNQEFFQTLEEAAETLPKAEQEKLFRPCAIYCVKQYALNELLRQYHECDDDLDKQYTKYGRTEYFFADIIEKGHVYEIGYPRCLCGLTMAGFAKKGIHCECSRQSILYVYEQMLPGRKVTVEMLHTVLSGANECRFRVTM